MQLLAEIAPRAPSFVDGEPLYDELFVQAVFGEAPSTTSGLSAGTSTATATGFVYAFSSGAVSGVVVAAATGFAYAFGSGTAAGTSTATATGATTGEVEPEPGVISEAEIDRRAGIGFVDPLGSYRLQRWRGPT